MRRTWAGLSDPGGLPGSFRRADGHRRRLRGRNDCGGFALLMPTTDVVLRGGDQRHCEERGAGEVSSMALNQPLITRVADGEKPALPQTTSVSRPSSDAMRPAPAADIALSKSASRPTSRLDERRRIWLDAYDGVRRETERRAAPLAPEDQVIQSMADASPTKWHRAHTTWFFEQFLVMPKLADYLVFDERFAFLFNSYYVAAGPRHERPKRGLLTRPTCDEVAAYRTHVDARVARMLAPVSAGALDDILPVLELGLHHEQQHQELILTDILHAFAQNPCAPAYDAQWTFPASQANGEGIVVLDGGVYRIGHDGDGFMFDNEGPAHEVLLQPVRLGNLVTNAEWLEFMADGGYGNAMLWLSDGWANVQAEGWSAPGYWRQIDGAWFAMTLAGRRAVDPAAPVCHVSYYEADAFARWAGRHLPTEAEWEAAARSGRLADAFGIVWQWTRSAYAPYPGYRATADALGEYNGKFMVNQMVLRGSSLATPEGHARASYRNFFYPPSLAIHRPAARRLRIGPPRRLTNKVSPHACTCPRCASLRTAFDDGKLRRRRDGRPDGGSEGAAGEVFLRQHRLAPVRAHYRAARILSDPHRARDPENPCSRHRKTPATAICHGRVRQRLRPEGVDPAARRAACRRLSAGGYFVGISAPGSRAFAPQLSQARCGSDRRRFLPAVHAAGRGYAIAPRRLLSRLHHRQLRAARGLHVPAQCRKNPRAGRDAHRRRRPGEGPRGAQRRLQRRGRRDGEVQSQCAGAHQSRARCQFQSQMLRASRLLQPRALAHRDASRQHPAAEGEAQRRDHRVPRRRDDPHREQLQVHAQIVRR